MLNFKPYNFWKSSLHSKTKTFCIMEIQGPSAGSLPLLLMIMKLVCYGNTRHKCIQIDNNVILFIYLFSLYILYCSSPPSLLISAGCSFQQFSTFCLKITSNIVDSLAEVADHPHGASNGSRSSAGPLLSALARCLLYYSASNGSRWEFSKGL